MVRALLRAPLTEWVRLLKRDFDATMKRRRGAAPREVTMGWDNNGDMNAAWFAACRSYDMLQHSAEPAAAERAMRRRRGRYRPSCLLRSAAVLRRDRL